MHSYIYIPRQARPLNYTGAGDTPDFDPWTSGDYMYSLPAEALEHLELYGAKGIGAPSAQGQWTTPSATKNDTNSERQDRWREETLLDDEDSE